VKKQTKFSIGAAIIVLTLGWLAWSGVTESKTYYHTLAELSTLHGSDLHHRIRVGGNVQAGSIHRLSGRVDFIIEGEGKTLPVSYVGTDPLPDTFVDGSQALVEGKAMPDGRFVADSVQAKCASKYEAAPAQPAPGSGASGTPDKKS
jgi:cytochrome c-type biogenesis protein CcmE